MNNLQKRRNNMVKKARRNLGRNMKRLKSVMRSPRSPTTRGNHLKNLARRGTPSPVSHRLTPVRSWFKAFRRL
jgi:hypothetical protein